MQKIDQDWASTVLNKIISKKVNARKLRLDTYRDLRPYATQILILANHPKGSKRNIQRYLNELDPKLEVRADVIYHFVKSSNGGVWPRARARKGGK